MDVVTSSQYSTINMTRTNQTFSWLGRLKWLVFLCLFFSFGLFSSLYSQSIDLTSIDSTFSGQVYTASSTKAGSRDKSYAFDNEPNRWGSDYGTYDSSGSYTGTALTEVYGGNDYSGAWLQVDLGSPKTATKIYVGAYNPNNPGAPQDFKIFGSNNGGSWAVLLEESGYTNDDWLQASGVVGYDYTKEFVLSSEVTYQYYRIAIGSTVQSNVDIAHFRVDGYEADVSNEDSSDDSSGDSYDIASVDSILTNLVYTHSSTRTSAGYGSEKAFDNYTADDKNHQIMWQSQSNLYESPTGTYLGSETTGPDNYEGEWIQVDCGESVVLTSFIMEPFFGKASWNGQYFPEEVKLFSSLDGSTWTEVKEVVGLTLENDWKKNGDFHSPLPPPESFSPYGTPNQVGPYEVSVVGRYFRLVNHKTLGSDYTRIGELRLFGYQGDTILASSDSSDSDSDSSDSNTNNLPVTTGLKLHLDASNVDGSDNSTLSNGDTIGVWKDLSGNQDDAIQSISNKQPQLLGDQLNNKPVIKFDGSNDYFEGDYSTAFNNDDITIFIIKKQTDSNHIETFYSTDADYGFNYLEVTHWDNIEITFTYFNEYATGIDYFVSAVEMNSNDFDLYTVKFDATNNTQESYKNGIKDTANDNAKEKMTHDIVAKTLSNYLIGTRPDRTNTLDGEIAELIIFSQSLEESEMFEVHNYLSEKWGLTSLIDSDGDGTVDANDSDADGDGVDDSVGDSSSDSGDSSSDSSSEDSGLDPNEDADNDGVNNGLDDYPLNSYLVSADFAPASDIYGSVAYEDLWPEKGDYDFNDVIIDYQYKYGKDGTGKVKQIEASIKISSYAQYTNGVGLILEDMADKIESVSGVGLVNSITVGSNGLETGNGDDAVIVISTNQKHDQSATLNVTIVFSECVTKSSLGDAPHNLFIFSKSTRGREIHLPGHKHSAKMNTNLFQTGDDNTSSNTASTRFKTSDDLPWALHIAEKFDHPKEGKSIHEAYTKFSDWAQSGGNNSQDWFSNMSHRNADKIKSRN